MKKFFKIFSISLGILILVFFSIGLFSPSVNYTVQAEINKPLAETFETFNDLEKIQNWIPEITNIEAIKETPNIVGSQYIMSNKNEEQSIDMKETVTSYELNKSVGLYFEAGDMLKTDLWTFEAKGEKTIVKLKAECEGASLFFKSMFFFFKSMFIDIDQTYLNAFKRYIEQN